jgi:hypothetical protein
MKTKLILSALTLTAVLMACLTSTVVLSRDQSLDSSNVSLSGKHLKITGSRTGTVSVFSRDSGRLVRTFDMQHGHVVRGLHLLSNETVLVGAQLGQSVFWDLDTGKRTFVISQMVVGFSPDRSKFLSFANSTLYIYDSLTKSTICSFSIPTSMGLADQRFSPDGNHLAVLIGTGWPVSDSVFPAPPSIRKGVRLTKLYNIIKCKENKLFSNYFISTLGKFSEDSKYYDLINTAILNSNKGEYVRADWRLNLEFNKLEKKEDRK